MQKRKGRIWGLLGIIVLYGILEDGAWLDEQDIDLGDAVTRLVQYFEDDDSANDAGWMEEEDAESDEMLSVSAEKQSGIPRMPVIMRHVWSRETIRSDMIFSRAAISWNAGWIPHGFT